MKKLMSFYKWLFVVCTLLFVSCNDENVYTEYSNSSNTEIGNRIVSNSTLVAHIFNEKSEVVAPGVNSFYMDYLSDKGLAMKLFIYEVDLNVANVDVKTTMPNDGVAFGLQEMTKQVALIDRAGSKVVGAVNGDFFKTNGQTQGVIHKGGKVIKDRFDDAGCSFFCIKNDKTAFIGDQSEYKAVKSDIRDAVGGRVWLVRDGVAVVSTANAVEPRTCIGVTKDNKVYMAVIDGRRFSYSNGMNYSDMSKLMVALGTDRAINLDGGGSSTFVRRKSEDFAADNFYFLNYPTDNAGQERKVANGLAIVLLN